MSSPGSHRSRNGHRHGLLLSSLLASIVAGCSAGNGDGLDISGRPLSEGGDLPLAPTLASIQANVFNPACIVCHSGANAPQGLRLDSANSFTNLVGMRSTEVGSLFRVAPGDPDNSYLIHKLEGTASVGAQMPFGGPPIPQATIDFVRQWITDGAMPIAAGPSGSPPVVVSLSFVPGTASGESLAQIVAAFDQDMDASSIHTMTFVLLRSGGDGRFDDGNEQVIAPASVSLSNINARLAIMDLAGVAVIADRYQVTLRGSGASMILGVNGMALDGEYAGNRSSGDGLEGGNYVAEFDVAGRRQ
ncbi:MAG: hypothetical protein IIA07_13695 [Proteobacteria bacterium]|nr:hypothetical protein [Pseudomonadota bacterium]